jgi:putative flippase GtrA
MRTRRPSIAKLARYGSVSAVSTATGLAVLGILAWVVGLPAAWANVVATAVGTIPSFELNRRWVWGRTGDRSLTGEVAPFVVLSFAGLLLSTLAVHVTAAWASHHGWPVGTRTGLIELAQLGAYGSLWILQFLVLDRVLFRPPTPGGSGQVEEPMALRKRVMIGPPVGPPLPGAFWTTTAKATSPR